jgi:CheY-like chemotaxis protein
MEKKLLVADDSLTIQKVVELTFADSDYRLTCVPNGRLALEKIREERPDVVLADVVMPEKNGYEVCEEIKKNPATAGIPVILLAGTFEPFDRERATRMGCDAIVSKPFDSRELYRKVESLVGMRSEAASPARPPEAPGATDRSTPPDKRTTEEPSAPTPFTAVAPNPFEAGFVEEDFTGSIRTLRAGRGEPLANLYGPEDVESALAAFREVEPTARATDWRAASRLSDPGLPRVTPDSVARSAAEDHERKDSREPGGLLPAGEDGRTQRIDVSEFRPPRSSGMRSESTVEIGRVEGAEVPPAPTQSGPDSEVEFAEPLPPLPDTAVRPAGAPPIDAGPVERPVLPHGPGTEAFSRELTDAEIDRIAEKLAAKLVERLSDRIVREVAWEVVPETAELVVRERLRDLESGVE